MHYGVLLYYMETLRQKPALFFSFLSPPPLACDIITQFSFLFFCVVSSSYRGQNPVETVLLLWIDCQMTLLIISANLSEHKEDDVGTSVVNGLVLNTSGQERGTSTIDGRLSL